MKSLRITGGAGKMEHTTRWARQITYRLDQITSLYMRLFGSDSELNGLQSLRTRGLSAKQLSQYLCLVQSFLAYKYLAGLTVSKKPGTGYQIEIHFAVVNHLYLLFSLVKLVET